MSHCLTVEFDIVESSRAEFLERVRENAAQSVRDEPGCLRFDVLAPKAGGPLLLYEIYADRGAFEAHLASPHFLHFDRATKDMVLRKVVTEFALFEHAKTG